MPSLGMSQDGADTGGPREDSKQGRAPQVCVLERSPAITREEERRRQRGHCNSPGKKDQQALSLR